jgi:hypothetical protein
MGTSSMYGTHTFDVELDCPWMSVDVYVTFEGHSNPWLTELMSVIIIQTKEDITHLVNHDYISDLIYDFVSNADYHESDHGD